MSVIGIFCRTSHPAGYGGFPDVPSGAPKDEDAKYRHWRKGPEQFAGAHGYVTLLIECADDDELQLVINQMSRKWFNWQDRNDLWYSGNFDFVCSITGGGRTGFSSFTVGTNYRTNYRRVIAPSWLSLGDNRALAYLMAEEALEALSAT